jgi:hypothetical protein
MPIDPWRKSSSSGLKKEIEVAGVTVTTTGAMSIRGSRLGRASTASYDRQPLCAAKGGPASRGEAGPLKLGPGACGRCCRPHAAPCMTTRERCCCQGSENTHLGIAESG